MKDKRTNVGYGKGMASSGGSGGMRVPRTRSSNPKEYVAGGKKPARRLSPSGVKMTKVGPKFSKSAGNRSGKNPNSASDAPVSRSVSATKSKATTKPSTGKMSSRYAGKMKAMGKKA